MKGTVLDLRGSHQPLVSYQGKRPNPSCEHVQFFYLKSLRVLWICCQHVNILPKVS